MSPVPASSNGGIAGPATDQELTFPQRGGDPTALEPRPPPARLLSAFPLTLLSAILLVDLQAWTEPLQARTDEMPAQEQPPANDQDVVIYFSGDDSSSLQVPGSTKGLICHCRVLYCLFGEHLGGTCFIHGECSPICCF
ncbi:defensin-7-like [Macaca thibetana thibetana]|uniref:defensin-7-like n=1 Tax=Macaca thibetana thibetana TaxID=257877 RepID=UPI0021BCF28D|nr:defensin-7-like [Macaca thibetana thibetana]